MKALKKIWLVGCMVLALAVNVEYASAAEIIPEEIEIQKVSDSETQFDEDYTLVETIDLGEGVTCEVYKTEYTVNARTSTAYGATNFKLYYNGTYFGYLQQKTTWTYDKVNRPTYVESSHVFYTDDPSGNYMKAVSSYTAPYKTSSTQYVKVAKVYYNSKYIATTDFSTICDKNGNCSYVAADE